MRRHCCGIPNDGVDCYRPPAYQVGAEVSCATHLGATVRRMVTLTGSINVQPVYLSLASLIAKKP
jgi:hypothetical protein